MVVDSIEGFNVLFQCVIISLPWGKCRRIKENKVFHLQHHDSYTEHISVFADIVLDSNYEGRMPVVKRLKLDVATLDSSYQHHWVNSYYFKSSLCEILSFFLSSILSFFYDFKEKKNNFSFLLETQNCFWVVDWSLVLNKI